MPKTSEVLFTDNKDILDYLKQSRLFGHIEEPILKKLVPLSKFVSYAKGTKILKEGELNNTIFFLVRGAVSVYTQDEYILSLHRLGDIFGEISIISDKPCNATVIADDDVNLFCFSSGTVGSYSDLHPEELQNVLYRIFAKILTEKLYLTTTKAQQFEKTNDLLLTTQKSLETVHEKLKKSHGELEKRVKQRTKALTTANEKLQEEIAERKKLEEERSKLELQLRHSQKMETIGTLAGGIAHEFNNLLQGMFIGMDILNMNLPDDSPLKEHLLNSQKFGQSAKTLINQILTFSHQEEEKLELIEIVSSVEETLKMIGLTFPSSVEIKQNIKINPEKVLGNTTQLQQILINLCTNAKYAMQEEGVLEVTLVKEFLNESKINDLGLEKEGEYLKLTIKDTGSGIPQKIQERIFDPFFTTKPVGEGSGMGLSVVHGIIQNWKGAITVESEEGKGAQFDIHFPSSEQ